MFFFNDTAPPDIYTLSLHDALPISYTVTSASAPGARCPLCESPSSRAGPARVTIAISPKVYSRVKPSSSALPANRSEEHTSELQSHSDLVCRLLLEKKKKKNT